MVVGSIQNGDHQESDDQLKPSMTDASLQRSSLRW